MADSKTKGSIPETINFDGIGNADGMDYTKADLFKAVRLGGNFVVSCYQFDYSAIVNAMKGISDASPGDSSHLLAVGKLVMDAESFHRLRTEINTLHENVFNQKNKNGK